MTGRREFLKSIAFGAASAMFLDLERILAQETQEQPTPHQQISRDFYSIAKEFYSKAKDKDKTKEALEISLYFDSFNKEAEDLLKKLEKEKLNKNDKLSKKAEENYKKKKQESIETLAKLSAEKLKNDKQEAYKEFEGIWKIENNSEKPYDVLGFVKNEGGFYISKERNARRELGKKIFQNSKMGEIDNKKDNIEELMNIKPFRRSSERITSRSIVSDENAKQMHRAAEAAFTYLPIFLGIDGHPFDGTDYSKEFEEDIKKDGGKLFYRVTEFNKPEQFDKYTKEILGHKDYDSTWGTLGETWKTWERKNEEIKPVHSGHYHYFQTEPDIDNTVHNIANLIAGRNEECLVCLPLQKGLCYLITAELLGTTTTSMIYEKHGKYKGDKDKENTIRADTIDKMHSIVYELVRTSREKQLEKLVSTSAFETKVEDVSQAVSLMEFLRYHKDYQEPTLKMLTSGRVGNKWEFFGIKPKDLAQKAYGKSWETIHEDWRQYVLDENIGYRNSK